MALEESNDISHTIRHEPGDIKVHVDVNFYGVPMLWVAFPINDSRKAWEVTLDGCYNPATERVYGGEDAIIALIYRSMTAWLADNLDQYLAANIETHLGIPGIRDRIKPEGGRDGS